MATTADAPTLRALLGRRDLHLRLESEPADIGDSALDAPIRWVHSSDLADPTPFLSEGLALLTTNLRANVDRAFLRRLRFVVQFPFPDARQRARIWACHLPDDAPTKGLDTAALAKLNVAGGGIRSIALAAAFAAAVEGSPITPRHVLRAAEVEYAKAERTLTDPERAALR